jgi:hypothetical protein
MTNDEKNNKKEKAIEYLSKLPIYKWAAKSVGVDEDTLRNWRDEDKDFSARCESAKAEAIEKLGKRATPDFMLKSVDPQTFKERIDVTSGDKPIPIMGGLNVISNDNSNKEVAEVE